MGDLQVIAGIKKLNNQNYNTWSTCMMSYIQGQDLWEVVNGSEMNQLEAEDANGTLTFAELFSKKNDTRLQLLESELLSVAQRDLTITQYFHKVKLLCREISELDPEAQIGETRVKRTTIHGLRLEFRSFVATVQGWQNQPSLVEFENLLAGGIPSSTPSTELKRTRTRQKVIKVKGAPMLREIRRILAPRKKLKGSVIIAGRRVTWQKIVGQKKDLWKVMLLLPKVKMSATLRHLLLQ
ncbi:hypothetical protein CsSME_00033756 [Camellia sinensis var. sinensis]